MKNKNQKQIAKISIFITSIFVIFLSVSYSFINLTLTGTKKQVITVGNLDLELEEDENNLTITNAMPTYDEVGMIQEPFTFRLVNKTATDTNYVIKLLPININNLPPNNVKYGLEKDEIRTIDLVSNLKSNIIDSGTIKGNQIINYTLRLWIKDDITENSIIENKVLSYKINIDSSQEIEWIANFGIDKSNPNPPVLATGMIPVVYNEKEKSWVKADTTQTKYYNYDEQMWANAVTVTETNRDTYMNAAPGTSIPIEDINTMWVWIPRYEYQYTDLGKSYASGTKDLPGEIKLKFISANQTTPSDSAIYKIPEGFKFGEENTSGFWIGKFETTGRIPSACTSENCSNMDLTIKPNVSSLSSHSISSFFYASRSMQNASNANKYGFDIIGTGTMDTHMSKNSEWGIVAMLSQSKYGKYGNSKYTGIDKEIAINNCSSYITGIGGNTILDKASSVTCITNTYETDKGRASSTTGTINGVYDMSGGVWEYVMGNYNNTIASSKFSVLPEQKYYDLYTTTDASIGYKQGDATYETSGWYYDHNFFVWESGAWFSRGGSYSNTGASGIFNFHNGYIGAALGSHGFRLALKP